jgi:hypothetical protein
MSTIKERLLALREQRTALIAMLQATAKQAFKEFSQELFNSFPQLGSFEYTQYTPYFNDGDACVFRVSSDYPTVYLITGEQIDDYPIPADQKELYEAVQLFLRGFEKADLLNMFGDHVQVVVNRSGVEVNEYEHE